MVRLASLGFQGVATYGASITRNQFNIIRGMDRIIFAMDNDDAGRASAKSIVYMCNEALTEAWFFNYDGIDVKDVGAMSLDEIKSGVDKARHITRGDKAV